MLLKDDNNVIPHHDYDNNNYSNNYHHLGNFNFENFGGKKTLGQKINEKKINNFMGETAIKNLREPTSSWKDLKLFLSYPLSERNSDIDVMNSTSMKCVIHPMKDGKKENYDDNYHDDNHDNKSYHNGDTNDYDNYLINMKKNRKLNYDFLPDATRIGLDLENDLRKNNFFNFRNENKRQSLTSHLLKNENKHNIDNDEVYRINDGLKPNMKIMQSLVIGTGTKSLLLSNEKDKNDIENIIMNRNASNSANLIFLTLESKIITKSQSEKLQLGRTKKEQKVIKKINKKNLPLILGMRK